MSTPNGSHDRLREERVRLGYNQTEFAAVAGTTQRSQTVYETGKRSPDLEYLAAIATIGADVQYIATGKRTVANSVPVDAMEKAISTAFEMIKTSGVEVTSGQFVQMVKTLLPQPSSIEAPMPTERDAAAGSGNPSMGHGNMIASGSGITQVGGRISISRRGKMKSN
ncbi:helix-turn-helix transcriptional regulator [Burkholderia multivorans]|uniref:helix-turn-helix domain-containing protein n=1 Tax=Burkholderia TaxID=32008 RepID=UPI0005F1F9C4|nr:MULTISPECIES: helix-turn-helix transcriptional regulator [Burkholderia]MCO7334134.1 helix-turn-helix transcriptional regulator [Burkholderia multivorans]MCO7341924.1 helix-turn-helix transcriptional regulator [Burkholderia multivorans]MCO7347875.1 helix-turn-helix transcriptional regulator [Burkholderia multivorans]PNE77927.1 XRE family transcriptional regulator [Burkholderia thailandensis]QET32455.1 helix-turn-helix transcriptional regulator [Burkholderia multivorans]